MDSLGKWVWLTQISSIVPDCSLGVTEFCNSRQAVSFFFFFFLTSVLQLRKCLPSLEINLGSWPPCCKISYNIAVNIGQLIDRDIFSPAVGLHHITWSLTHVECTSFVCCLKCQQTASHFLPMVIHRFSSLVKDIAVDCLTVNWSSSHLHWLDAVFWFEFKLLTLIHKELNRLSPCCLK